MVQIEYQLSRHCHAKSSSIYINKLHNFFSFSFSNCASSVSDFDNDLCENYFPFSSHLTSRREATGWSERDHAN